MASKRSAAHEGVRIYRTKVKHQGFRQISIRVPVTLDRVKELLAVFALMVSLGGSARANDAPEPATQTTEQAQARQFGIFFGGTASQYDLCVKKGFLPKGDQSAEEIAKSFLQKMWAANPGADQSAYVQDGWNMIKKEIADNDSFFTQEKCASVGKQWTKLLAEMQKK